MTSENLTPAQDPSVITDAVEAAPKQELIIERMVDTVYRAITTKALTPSGFIIRCSNEAMRIMVSNGMSIICKSLLRQAPFQVSIPDGAGSRVLESQSVLCKQIAANQLCPVVDGNFENEYQMREFVDLVGFKFNVIDLLYPGEAETRAGIVKRYVDRGEDNPFPGMEIRFNEAEGENLLADAQGVVEHIHNYFLPLVEQKLAEMAATHQAEVEKSTEADEQPAQSTETPTEG